jgi:multidrug efflux pump
MGRFGLLPSAVDNTLYDAFGERQVSTIYNAMNQYAVVMEVAPEYWQNPETLRKLYVSTAGQNASGTQSSNAVSGTVTSPSTSPAGSRSSAGVSSSASNNSARNQATNAIAASGRSSASSGAAVSTAIETMIPLAAFTHYVFDHAPLSVNHQGLFVASTISFNLAPEYSLSDAVAAIRQTIDQIQMPGAIQAPSPGRPMRFNRRC